MSPMRLGLFYIKPITPMRILVAMLLLHALFGYAKHVPGTGTGCNSSTFADYFSSGSLSFSSQAAEYKFGLIRKKITQAEFNCVGKQAFQVMCFNTQGLENINQCISPSGIVISNRISPNMNADAICSEFDPDTHFINVGTITAFYSSCN